jgi:hypothetical protein
MYFTAHGGLAKRIWPQHAIQDGSVVLRPREGYVSFMKFPEKCALMPVPGLLLGKRVE